MFNVVARRVSRLHKIFGLVIGIQFLFWVASGFYFTLYPIDAIHGDHMRVRIDHGVLNAPDVIVSAQDAMDASGIWVFRADLHMLMGEPVWQVSNTHSTVLISASTGERMSPISQGLAEDIFNAGVPGLASYEGDIFLLEENPPREYAGPLPAWVYETDGGKERAYIDASTGDIRAVRTTEWRIFDVFWRFHIMDITGDDRIDTWWMKLAAFIAMAMVITGFIILAQRIQRGRIFS